MANVTTLDVLNNCSPNYLADGCRKVGLGTLLSKLATPKTETLAVNATFQCTLSEIPLPGSVVAARKTGGYLAQTEVHPLCTLGAHQFLVDYDTGEVTFETTDFNDTNEAVFAYTGLAASTTGTALAAELANDFAE